MAYAIITFSASFKKRDMKKMLIAAIAIFSLLNVHAQENKIQRTINVSGSAEMEIVPDEIYVQIDLREYEKKGSGKVDIETIRNKFLNAIKNIGLTEEDISVQGYSGWDANNIWYNRKKKKDPNMMAGITYLVKLSSTKKMDELVGKLDDEATQNFFISRVSHSKILEYKKQLKIQAVKAAKEKAIYLAEAIDAKIGDPITINEPNEVGFHPMPIYRKMGNVALESVQNQSADAPMNVDFKKIKLQFDVHVTFGLK